MLVDERRAVVDLVMDHDIHVLLGVVLSNILVGKLESGRHGGRTEGLDWNNQEAAKVRTKPTQQLRDLSDDMLNVPR